MILRMVSGVLLYCLRVYRLRAWDGVRLIVLVTMIRLWLQRFSWVWSGSGANVRSCLAWPFWDQVTVCVLDCKQRSVKACQWLSIELMCCCLNLHMWFY